MKFVSIEMVKRPRTIYIIIRQLKQEVGERSVSDHCPIWLKGMVKDWGPKPFKPFMEEGWKSPDKVRGNLVLC